MRLVTYSQDTETRTGAAVDGWIVDLERAHRAAVSLSDSDGRASADVSLPVDMVSLLAGGDESLAAAARAVEFIRAGLPSQSAQFERTGMVAPLDEVTLLSPVLRPSKLVCVGINYRKHAVEANLAIPNYPILFLKVVGSLVGHGQPVLIPRINGTRVDFEGELAVVVGRRGKYISEADALSYVAGYASANDVSARDLQFRTSQWTTGKMLDTFCPLGPYLVTRDEVPDPNALRLRTLLNGVVMQDASTAEMIFSVAAVVSYLSSIVTIEPGDVILTGTPGGIGSKRNPPVFMKAGDTVTVDIERVGTLTNPLVAE